ncbi:MAG: hypothetical protein V6Z82_07025 [Flavobacteriales bacterium]
MNIKKVVGLGILLIVLTYGYKTGERVMTRKELNHFTPSEFGVWWPFMSNDLLEKLDELRERWGKVINVSPAAGGIGRHGGDATTQHNVDLYGEVRAVDIFPSGLNGNNVDQFYQLAKDVGFTGIGVYADTQYAGKPHVMFHVDVRKDRQPGSPAKWGRIAGNYVSLEKVLGHV